MRINSYKRNILLLLAGIGLSGTAAPNGPEADLSQNITGLIGHYLGPVYDFRRNDPDSTELELIQRGYSFEICPPEQHGPRKSRLKLIEELIPLAELSTEQREELTQKLGCPAFDPPISDVFLICLDRARDEILGLNHRHLTHRLSLASPKSTFCGFRHRKRNYSSQEDQAFVFRSLGTNYMLTISAQMIIFNLFDNPVVLLYADIPNRSRCQLQEWLSNLDREYIDYLHSKLIKREQQIKRERGLHEVAMQQMQQLLEKERKLSEKEKQQMQQMQQIHEKERELGGVSMQQMQQMQQLLEKERKLSEKEKQQMQRTEQIHEKERQQMQQLLEKERKLSEQNAQLSKAAMQKVQEMKQRIQTLESEVASYRAGDLG